MHGRIKVVAARELASGARGAQGHERGVELALVADHDKVGHACGLGLDEVLHRDRGDVLTANADDELLVPAGNVEHVDAGAGALVTRVKVAVAVDRLGVLSLNLRDVLFAKARVRVVAHHDVAAAEADLALLLLRRQQHVLGPGALGLGTVRGDLEAAHLHTGHLKADRAHLEARVHGARGASGGLAHAVHLVDDDAERGKVEERVARHGRSSAECVGALAEAELAADDLEQRAVDAVEARLLASAADLEVAGVLETLALSGGGELFEDALGLGAHFAELLGDLLPHAGHTEEDGGLHRAEALAEGADLEVVRTSEVGGGPALEVRGEVHDRHDVDPHARNVREGKVRDAAHLLGHEPHAGEREQGFDLKEHVVVADHDRLGVAGGSRSVDEAAAVRGLDFGDALVKVLALDLLLAQLEQVGE
mmetsp:Transcript_25150/g.71058  ORF Transcript_25150/g.71058 Transcript_25150/m.71058 type:complete len:423 (+) Transcript_25150:114-1382(+)